MKYIMAEVEMSKKGGMTARVPFIFPNNMVHSLMVSAIGMACTAHGWQMKGVISAGETNIICESTFGESTTIGVEADPGDVTRINMADYGGIFL